MTHLNDSSAEYRIPNVWTVVVAAGGSSRFGSDKQKVTIGHKTVLECAVSTAGTVGSVVVVGKAEFIEEIEKTFSSNQSVEAVVAGGSTRTASVSAGLLAVPNTAEIILIHDGARPLASQVLFNRVIDVVNGGVDAVVPGIEISDSLRSVRGHEVNRSEVVAVQTPQGFKASAVRTAYLNKDEFTDDASKVEATGVKVEIIEGEPNNLKITHPVDLLVARQIHKEVEEND
ncbi:MAG TPA: 2-C-methyl-D-erythritol 4-phosphate cytidylyltransferase [Acidimicrobiales bacterium]|mgnify:FL=1|jgi:2-C-methyl-D-erythritol 4-phosphate cytidylyltransferase|nr:2-C-methyl-D-erythritol 4-phosphate cytidylyltransferase [Acidimicrobiales bacterium]